jgi:hypothetical protein
MKIRFNSLPAFLTPAIGLTYHQTMSRSEGKMRKNTKEKSETTNKAAIEDDLNGTDDLVPGNYIQRTLPASGNRKRLLRLFTKIKNKELIRGFVETVLINGQCDKIADYYHHKIRQNNPYIDNTIKGIVGGIQELRRQGITLQIEKIREVSGEENFELVLSEGKFNGESTAFYDLFLTDRGLKLLIKTTSYRLAKIAHVMSIMTRNCSI